MSNTEILDQRRQDIVAALLEIRSIRPGNINEQYVKSTKDGESITRGPYPVLCWREGKKVFSERLKSKQAHQLAAQDTANYKHFKGLCKELEELTKQLGRMEREQADEIGALKKKRKSPSSKTRMSRES